MTIGRIHIGIPTLDGRLHEECAAGLLSAWGTLPCSLSQTRGPLIGRNRDIISAEGLARADVSHVLFLDADMAWSVQDLLALLELDAPFAFGRYRQKASEVRWNHRPEAGRKVLRPASDGGVIEATEHERCGGGFVLVQRAALEAMSAASPEYIDPTGRTLRALWWGTYGEGEDYAFCRLWRSLGGRIVTRPDLTIGHVGSATYR